MVVLETLWLRMHVHQPFVEADDLEVRRNTVPTMRTLHTATINRCVAYKQR
jgi:hypothetical protein